MFNLDKLNKVSIHGFRNAKKIHLTADDTLLCINHYRYGSFEFLYGIKEGRGGGVNKNKYKCINTEKYPKKQTQFMILMESPNQQFMSNDSYLRDKSTDIIKLCKEKQISISYKPMVELYPNSSWLYLKKQP